jgi:hypothetical protein
MAELWDEERGMNETCRECACYSWGCPASYWDDEGYPRRSDGSDIITSFCFERRKDGED